MAGTGEDFGPMYVMSDRQLVAELFERCSKTDMRVVGCIIRHMSWDNNMLPETQRSIRDALAASSRGRAPSLSSVNESFRFLQGHPRKPSSKGGAAEGPALSYPLLVLTGGGNYMVNPSYFRTGDDKKRKWLEKRWMRYRHGQDPDIYARLRASVVLPVPEDGRETEAG